MISVAGFLTDLILAHPILSDYKHAGYWSETLGSVYIQFSLKERNCKLGFQSLSMYSLKTSHFCKSVWRLLLPSPWSYLRLFALASEVLLPVCGSFPKWKKNQPSSAKVKCLAWNKSMQFEQINAKHAYLQNSYLFIKRIWIPQNSIV